MKYTEYTIIKYKTPALPVKKTTRITTTKKTTPKKSVTTYYYTPEKHVESPDATKVVTPLYSAPVKRTYLYVESNAEAEKTKYTPTVIEAPDFNKVVTEQGRQAAILHLNSLKGKSKDEIKAYLRELANAGFYDRDLQALNVDQIKRVQMKLQKRGLYKKAIDGKIGKGTIAAWREYNVDGIIGNRTTNASIYLNNNNDLNFEYKGNNYDKGCAEFVTKHFNTITGKAEAAGAVGDAWRMPLNIVDKGGSYIYNIYTDPAFLRARGSVSDMRRLTLEAIKKHPIDYSKIRVGDIVGLFNNGSGYQGVANRDGTTYNTHVGIVVGHDKDGIPLIQHNLHNPLDQKLKGTGLYTERADRLGNRAIAVVVRSLYSPIKAATWKPSESLYSVVKEKLNNNLQTFIESAAGFGGILHTMYPDVDNSEILKMALQILQRETGLMNNTQSMQRDFKGTGSTGTKIRNWITSHGREIYHDWSGTDASAISSDLIKAKLTSFDGLERAFLGLHSPGDLDDPTKAAAAMTYLLSKYNHYFKTYAKEHPELKLTDADIRAATIKAYNTGISKFTSLGYDDETNEYAPYEIEALRLQNDPNAKIYDYNGTNYHRLFKNMPAVDLFFRRQYESDESNGKKGYSAAAEEASKYIITKKTGGILNYLNY